MKTKKLRLISALLAVAMMVLLAPTAALAATKTTADGFEYEVTMDGEAYIIGYNGSATEVEIPSTLDGKTVTKIGSHDNTIWGNNQVTSVKIPSTVKTIEAGVFAGCTNLTTVDLSEAESLDSIGAYAFQDSGLTSVCIPANVAEISLGAFYGCKNLQTVDLSKAIDLKVIGVDAFSGIIGNEPSIAEITIPAGVTEIGSGAFGGCSQLTKVIFESPSNLKDVSSNTFEGCSNATIYYSDEAVKTALSGKVGSAKMVKCVNVTFDPNGGSEVKAKMVEKGQKADQPTKPTRDGWDFAGWYTKDDNDKYELFDFNTPITDDMTLYARWGVEATPIGPATRLYPIAIDYGTAYDAEGNPITKAAAGKTVYVEASETALDGMTFERWEVRKGDVKLENDRAAKTSFTMPEGEVQLEAM